MTTSTEIITNMVGRTFTHVTGEVGDDSMKFTDADGRWVEFYHSQDCCESVAINDIVGDLSDLVNSPIVLAEEVTNEPDPDKPSVHSDSYTWTFYRFATAKGTVTVRWLGESNGYYSEGVAVRSSEHPNAW